MAHKSFKSQQPKRVKSVSGEQVPLIKLIRDKQKLQMAVGQQQHGV